MEDRKYKHFRLLRLGKHSNNHLQNSYNKHGKDNFKCEVIECLVKTGDKKEFNKYMLIDSGVGADMESVDTRLTSIYKFVEAGKTDSAHIEINNLRQSFYFIMQKVTPKYLSYVCLIESIDGVPFTDYGEDNAQATLQLIAKWGVTKGFLDTAIDAFKKKTKVSYKFFSLKRLIPRKPAKRMRSLL